MNALQGVILFLFYIFVMHTTAISIVSTQPGPNRIVTEGSNLTISCSSSMPWFFCLFHSPMGDKQCAIQESEVSSVCSSDTLLSLSGERSTCSLHIARVTRSMHGGWMCLLNEIKQFGSVKTIVNVEVGVPAKVGWKTDLDDGVLYLMDGEEKEIVCGATEGYPHTDFVWTSYRANARRTQTRNARMFEDPNEDFIDDSTDSLITNRTKKVSYSVKPGSHLYSGAQSLIYRANLSDNGTTFQCRGYQSTADGAILYTSSIELQLNVKELIVSQSTALEENLGIISGIILAIIFIILIFILLTIVISRRRKDNKNYSSLPNKPKEELLTPIWVPGKGSGVHVSSARQFAHDYHENDEIQGVGDRSEYSKGPTYNIHDPMSEHYKQNKKLTETLMDTSLESHSGDSFEENSRNHSVGGTTLSRPTTRTTKTISDTSDSSRSSIADKSAMREYQMESYISFHSELGNHKRGATEHVYGPDDTIASDRIVGDHIIIRKDAAYVYSIDDTIASEKMSDLGDVTISSNNTDSVSMFHETHFGDSFSDIPRTVIHSPLGRDQLPVKNLPATGKTIFDCELGCFITVEEYERRKRERNSF